MTRAIFGQTTVAILGELAARALGLFLSLVIARSLGPENFGQYGSIIGSLAIVSSILGLGLDTWLLQQGGYQEFRMRDLALSAAVTKLVFGLFVIGALAVMRNHTSYGWAFLLGALGVVGDALIGTAYAALRVRQKNLTVSIFQTVSPSAFICLLYVIPTNYITPGSVIGIQAALSWFIATALFVGALHFSGTNLPTVRKLSFLTSAWVFVIADVFANIYAQAPALWLVQTASEYEVGIFRAAMSSLQLVYVPLTVAYLVILPRLSASTDSPHLFRNLISLYFCGAVTYGIAAALFFAFSSPVLVSTMFGFRFAAASEVVSQFWPLPLMKGLSFTCVLVMLALRRPGLRSIMQIAAVVFCLLVTPVLTFKFGMSGAIASTGAIEALLLGCYAVGACHSLARWKQ